MKTILIADDHPITLNGIKQYVENIGYQVICTCQNGNEAFENIKNLNPDYVILDLNMPGMNGLEVLEKVRVDDQTTKIVLYTMYHEKSFLTKATKLGVNGYLLKDFALEELSSCLEKVSVNENWFSPKLDEALIINKHDSEVEKILTLTASEKKILSLIAKDHSTKMIAEMLFVSEKTVEKHRSNIVKKLGLPNERNILQRFALQNNIPE
ncbi:response regulator transcription factor [Flavobacterium sp. SUN052]|uniref:response regulator n=1 Tax=Flavobacterium sp. SUN052 TaxID=3002441 RepID=UPI00237E654C|nr:response regulator transcription factor [Flavobacterium sp. SUN052]MEC4005902.1 response regulator transcription factor [Flavobacterium sp. SUN052]